MLVSRRVYIWIYPPTSDSHHQAQNIIVRNPNLNLHLPSKARISTNHQQLAFTKSHGTKAHGSPWKTCKSALHHDDTEGPYLAVMEIQKGKMVGKKTHRMGASSIIINPIYILYILYSGYVLGPNPLFLGLHLKGVKQIGTGALIPKGFPYHPFFRL